MLFRHGVSTVAPLALTSKFHFFNYSVSVNYVRLKSFSFLNHLYRNTSERPTSKRVRDEQENDITPQERTDSEDGQQPRRKQRRSTSRPSLVIEPALPLLTESEGLPVQIGEEYQADVPLVPLSESEREKNPPVVTSKLVFSVLDCTGDATIDKFLAHLNTQARRSTGFELSPFALQIALEQLSACKGNEVQAAQGIKERLTPGPYYPGLKRSFDYEELCAFVRALEERGKNFEHISRYLLPSRTTSELIWLYYTRHKQLRMQSGSGLQGTQFVEDGGEAMKRVPISASRAISAYRFLATSVGDGFPMDCRVQLAFSACRRGALERERKKKMDGSLRQTSRLRNRDD